MVHCTVFSARNCQLLFFWMKMYTKICLSFIIMEVPIIILLRIFNILSRKPPVTDDVHRSLHGSCDPFVQLVNSSLNTGKMPSDWIRHSYPKIDYQTDPQTFRPWASPSSPLKPGSIILFTNDCLCPTTRLGSLCCSPPLPPVPESKRKIRIAYWLQLGAFEQSTRNPSSSMKW